jgi:hypothetical protein
MSVSGKHSIHRAFLRQNRLATRGSWRAEGSTERQRVSNFRVCCVPGTQAESLKLQRVNFSKRQGLLTAVGLCTISLAGQIAEPLPAVAEGAPKSLEFASMQLLA